VFGLVVVLCLSTYYWAAIWGIGISLSAFIFALGLVVIVLWKEAMDPFVGHLGYLAYPIILTVLVYALDTYHAEKDLVYFKTIMQYISSYCLAAILYAAMRSDTSRQNGIALATSVFSLLMIVVLVVELLGVKWGLSQTALFTDYAEYYQGLSRTITLLGLVVMTVFHEKSYIVSSVVLVFTSVLTISFISFGAMFGMLISFGLYVKATAAGGVIRSVLKAALLIACVLVVFIAIQNYIDALVNRFYLKLDVADYEQSRISLSLLGVSLWWNDIMSFLFGPGPMNYAVKATGGGYYRHPHNVISLLLVWYGVMGLPIIYILFSSMWRCLSLMASSTNFRLLLSLIFVNQLVLSFIGGDIEQNRVLITMAYLFLFARDINLGDFREQTTPSSMRTS